MDTLNLYFFSNILSAIILHVSPYPISDSCCFMQKFVLFFFQYNDQTNLPVKLYLWYISQETYIYFGQIPDLKKLS